jgi:hypothetical protein
MRLDQEAQKAEEEILGHARKIKDVAALKRILHECLATFEKALAGLPQADREEALGLYLDKIRRVTFSFHYVTLKRAAYKEFGRKPSREAMRTIVARHEKDVEDISHLYKFL